MAAKKLGWQTELENRFSQLFEVVHCPFRGRKRLICPPYLQHDGDFCISHQLCCALHTRGVCKNPPNAPLCNCKAFCPGGCIILTPKYRNWCAQPAFSEGKKAESTS